MNFAFSIAVALSTPAFAADIEPPIPTITPEAVVISIELPEVEVSPAKPLPSDLPKVTEAACNCYNLLKERFDHVPPMSQLLATAQTSHHNANVAVFKFPATAEFPNGMPHVAVIREELPDGSLQIEEYNYQKCNHSTRTITPNDPDRDWET